MTNSIIEKLLNGAEVEWKPLGEVAVIKTGQSISKSIISNNIGNYPVINSGKEPLGYINQYNTENDPIGITTRGAGVGSIIWQEGRYFRGNLNYSVTIKDDKKLNVRFLYHSLLFMQKEIHSLCTFTGIPALNASDLKKVLIPIPPLEIQQKIVKTLDKFTELEATLEATLEAELALRKKQYQYYRETLLTFPQDLDRGGYNDITKALYNSGNVVFKTLGEVCDIYLGLTYTPNYVNNGIKFISAQNTSNDFLDLKNVKYISKDDYYKITSNAKPKKGDILFTRVGSNLGHPVIIDVEDELCIFVSLGYLRVKDGILNTYVKHWMNTKLFWDQVSKNVHGSAKINLNTGWLKKFTIAVPPISEQQKIVEILDKFDRLTNSISEGLPKEIELRRKQYEYYREQLLNFPK
ncbi:restriction endonuclease subunit S [Mannheimia haemolytica]|uniref:restriction endonuclease subunit S n=1 Tax=Mannheimia haemolytica TaxID=75985 RepID=UPI002EB4C5B1|nr:restriction endonuclease subunit S [Mannheimia haemolytica]